MKCLPLTVSVFALFTYSASASDDNLFMRKGLETLYLQEAEKYLACRQQAERDCSFSEVEGFLELLELKLPEKRITPNYPTSAQSGGYAAVVTTELTITDSGLVKEVELLSCESGFGDTDLKHKWRINGRHCGKFERATEKALASYRFPAFPAELLSVPRKIKWSAIFALQGQTSYDLNAQFTDLKSYQIGKVRKLTKARDWQALEDYALKNLEKNLVFYYYAAEAALMLGKGQVAIDRFTQFLKAGGRSYWHFGVKAAVIAVPFYYELGNDQEVVDLVRNSLLEKYLFTGNLIAKTAVADALLAYASSLTLIEQPEIAKALLTLRYIKRHQQLHDDLPTDLMAMVNQQVTNIESQIIAIGRSKAEQLRDPSKLG